jgi:hypothetical protein
VTGLLVEKNGYSPIDVFSCVLRYWQLIESLFEPLVPSVRLFEENALGQVVANCGNITFGAIDPSIANPLLSGALTYINTLPLHGGVVALRDAEVAWRRLKIAITRPTEAELQCLTVGVRSIDFGRPNVLRVFDFKENDSFTARLRSIRAQLWREGAIVQQFPVLKHAFLPMLEVAQSLRSILERQ